MNRTEHLLFKLAEECAEVTQEASKAAIFGMEEMMPGQSLTNRERVIRELNDLFAIAEMLGICELNRNAIETKKVKVEKYMDYAEKTCGTLRIESAERRWTCPRCGETMESKDSAEGCWDQECPGREGK